MINTNLKKKIIKENLDLDSRLKKIFNYLLEKEEEEKLFLENLEQMKGKIKKKDFDELDNWDSYKKKDNTKGIVKKNNNEKYKKILIFEYKEKMINILFFNLIKFMKFETKIRKRPKLSDVKKNFKNFVFNKFLKINNKKINLYKNKEFYTIQSIAVIILDLRGLKNKIIIMNRYKCLSSLTSGMMFKKLQLRNKKYKKSEKIAFLVVKTMLNHVNYLKNYKNIIINVKGVNKNINNIINYLNKKILYKNKNLIYINNSKISRNKFFKFKKVKSIKRRLRKKIIKFK